MTDIKTDLGRGFTAENPFMTASGTYGYGTEYSDITPPEKWGAIVLKTVTLRPREGNPPPRCCETDSGMLNSIGLANTGIGKFLSEKLPALKKSFPGAKCVASIAGETTAEFAELAGLVGNSRSSAAVEAVELNFSCPNVAKGGIHFGADTSSAAEAVKECRKNTDLPLWVKISPAAADPVRIAGVCAEAGSDCIVAGNTMPGMVIDTARLRPLLGNITGGLSGPALFPVSLRTAYMIATHHPGITLIGCGGIDSADKAIQFLLAGCSAVQVGTAVFRKPDILDSLLKGLTVWMEKNSFKNIKDFSGKALNY